MKFRRLDAVSSKGDGPINEDAEGSTARLAWVIDGATQLAETTPLPALTEGRWLADVLGAILCRPLDDHLRLPADARDLLSLASIEVGRRLSQLAYPAALLPPVASIGVALLKDDTLHCAVLGDVTVLVRLSNRTCLRLADDRFSAIEEAAVSALRQGRDVSNRVSVAAMLQRRRGYISGMGPRVLSNEPSAATAALHLSVPAGEVADLLLFTDGFGRLVDTYKLLDTWARLADNAASASLTDLVARLREYEEQRLEIPGRFKRRDDATALRLSISDGGKAPE